MITGFSKIEHLIDLVDILQSEILELGFAIDDRQHGDELDPQYFVELSARKEVLEQLLARLT